MENNKLVKKIRDWAINLGFRLPDGSPPPPHYFALLTLTPHRRQLWEAVVESVQPRQKVELMRKQLVVAKLQDEKKFAKSNCRQVNDRIELWHKQKGVEDEIKEQRSAVLKFEKNIMAKASDLLFEICILKEMEKKFDELKEKSLVLKLILKREKKVMETLDRSFSKESKILNLQDDLEKYGRKENLQHFMNELLNVEKCKYSFNDIHDCKTLNKLEELCKFGIKEEFIWEEVIKLKKNWLNEFSGDLKGLISSEKVILSEKDEEIERSMNFAIIKLKEKMMEKSLQVIMNSMEEKLLDLEIEKLEERLLGESAQDQTLNEEVSFFSPQEINRTCSENEQTLKNLNAYLNVVTVKSYQEFLKRKLKQLEEETEPEVQDQWKEFKSGEEGLLLNTKAVESVVDEINSLKLEEKGIEMQIIDHHDKLQVLERFLEEEVRRNSESRGVEVIAHKMKLASEKQIEILSENPLEAFRTIESPSGKILFECESNSHCLVNYGGECKQFFSALLIAPLGDLKQISLEVCKRQKIINKVKKFTSERERLAAFQKKIYDELDSISHDSRLCEKNFKESDGLLWNVLSKADELLKETDFIEKILKNWVEQPYRLMIKEFPEGKSLKEFEEQVRKGKNG